MKREIKFRVWYEEQKRFIDLNGLDILFDGCANKGAVYRVYEQGGLGTFQIYDIELEQFTGLQDRNGKDIYEGDIVRPFTDEINLAQVIYLNASFSLATKKRDNSYVIWKYNESEIEIIGNIHENKELLK